MSISDPIADMLTRMRNGIMVRHDSVMVPTSKVKLAIAQVLKDEGFIKEFEVVKDKTNKSIKITLKYAGKNQPAVVGLETDKQTRTEGICRAWGNSACLRRSGYRHRLHAERYNDR